MTQPIARLTLERADTALIQSYAVKDGMTLLVQDGLRKIKQGLNNYRRSSCCSVFSRRCECINEDLPCLRFFSLLGLMSCIVYLSCSVLLLSQHSSLNYEIDRLSSVILALQRKALLDNQTQKLTFDPTHKIAIKRMSSILLSRGNILWYFTLGKGSSLQADFVSFSRR